MIWICWYMSWNFYHKFVFQYKMLKQVLWNFRRDKRIFKKYFNMLFLTSFCPRLWLTGQVGRPHGSTAPRAGRPVRSTDVHRAVHVWQTQGRSTRTVDRNWEQCSLFISVGRAVDRVCPTVIFLTVGGRPGRSTVSLSGCQISLTASFLMGLYKPHFFGILAKIFRADFLPFSGFKNKF